MSFLGPLKQLGEMSILLPFIGVALLAGAAGDGCNSSLPSESPAVPEPARIVTEVLMSGYPTDRVYMETVMHDGHKYVVSIACESEHIQVLHSPACPCHQLQGD